MADSNQNSQTTSSSTSTASTIVGVVFGLLIIALYSGGAAKLSYDRYGSVGWAILAFIFAPFYYPIYAYFINSKPTGLIGGMRKMKW